MQEMLFDYFYNNYLKITIIEVSYYMYVCSCTYTVVEGICRHTTEENMWYTWILLRIIEIIIWKAYTRLENKTTTNAEHRFQFYTESMKAN